MNPVTFNCTVLRDGHQSLAATRMKTEDMLPIAPILDSMGYDYIAFDDHHFKEDLQYSDAVPMFHRLQALADREGLEFGLKLSNTFPVDVKAGELPSEEMYMAGKSLFPLTTTWPP